MFLKWFVSHCFGFNTVWHYHCFLIPLFEQTNISIKLYETVARAEGGGHGLRGAFLVCQVVCKSLLWV